MAAVSPLGEKMVLVSMTGELGGEFTGVLMSKCSLASRNSADMLLAVPLGDLGESLGETATIAVVESKKGLGGLAIVTSSPGSPLVNVGRGDASRGLGVGAALSM